MPAAGISDEKDFGDDQVRYYMSEVLVRNKYIVCFLTMTTVTNRLYHYNQRQLQLLTGPAVM